jgi:hypothetical protein
MSLFKPLVMSQYFFSSGRLGYKSPYKLQMQDTQSIYCNMKYNFPMDITVLRNPGVPIMPGESTYDCVVTMPNGANNILTMSHRLRDIATELNILQVPTPYTRSKNGLRRAPKVPGPVPGFNSYETLALMIVSLSFGVYIGMLTKK